jgi:hypothetical protein
MQFNRYVDSRYKHLYERASAVPRINCYWLCNKKMFAEYLPNLPFPNFCKRLASVVYNSMQSSVTLWSVLQCYMIQHRLLIIIATKDILIFGS